MSSSGSSSSSAPSPYSSASRVSFRLLIQMSCDSCEIGVV